MSRSAAYCVLIRDGEKRWYADVWGSLRRELVWGPEAFESWVTAGDEIDWEPEDISDVAIVNFDTKTLAWGEQDVLTPPKSHALHRKLLEHAWPGFSIKHLPSWRLDAELYALLDEPVDFEPDEEDGWEERPSTVNEAAEYFGLYDDDDDDDDTRGKLEYRDDEADGDDADDEEGYEYDEYNDDDDDDEEEMEKPFSEDLPGAWITIIDEQGAVRHRGLAAISVDLLSGSESALQELAQLDPVDLPEERYVTEGLWIHLGDRTIGYWGSEAEAFSERLQSGWSNWKVESAAQGYSRQCQISGPPGEPMSDAEALATFLPLVLSNKRMTMANLFGAMGSSLKRTAIKATGCLTMVLALPILLVGLFMDMWKEAGYALLTLLLIVVVLFKLIETGLKEKLRESGFVQKDEALEQQRPPVAGPQDEASRKQKVNEMLIACGLPSLAEVEPQFRE